MRKMGGGRGWKDEGKGHWGFGLTPSARIIRKTKCSHVLKRSVYFIKTKRITEEVS